MKYQRKSGAMEDSKIPGLNNQKKKWNCILPRWRRLGTDCNQGGMSGLKIKMSVLDVLSFAVKKAVGQVHRSGVQKVYLKIKTVILRAQILFKVMSLREILGLGSGADKTERPHSSGDIPMFRVWGEEPAEEIEKEQPLRKERDDSVQEAK